MKTADITTRARYVASRLAHNDQAQVSARYMLLDLAHRLDAADIQVVYKSDGLLLTDGTGKARYATWREALAYRLAGSLPSRL